jgi:myo-inositol-1(or 4)-monophosphatase
MPETEAIVRRVLDAAREAGRIILDGRKGSKHVERKGRIDLVTETDREVEEFLKERLGSILPEAAILAEESAADAGLADPCWVIDPLDGTTNFAHDLPVTATSVALWRGGSMELGVIGVPVLNEYFHAVRGGGAFLNGEPVRVTDTDDPEKALIATGFPYAIRENIRAVVENLESVLVKCRGVRRMGAAAVDLAYLAAGRFDGFYEAMLHPWDTAAGLLLVREAGGRVTTFDGGEYDIFQNTILASNGPLHEPLRGMLVVKDV